mmetsp:Transcript_13352/g.30587  ORF Transcript_13352/g.30587 Transcript_13352/m.30587 type:complete len:215 (+) Transcript_13352:37-681(+)
MFVVTLFYRYGGLLHAACKNGFQYFTPGLRASHVRMIMRDDVRLMMIFKRLLPLRSRRRPAQAPPRSHAHCGFQSWSEFQERTAGRRGTRASPPRNLPPPPRTCTTSPGSRDHHHHHRSTTSGTTADRSNSSSDTPQAGRSRSNTPDAGSGSSAAPQRQDNHHSSRAEEEEAWHNHNSDACLVAHVVSSSSPHVVLDDAAFEHAAFYDRGDRDR